MVKKGSASKERLGHKFSGLEYCVQPVSRPLKRVIQKNFFCNVVMVKEGRLRLYNSKAVYARLIGYCVAIVITSTYYRAARQRGNLSAHVP